MSSSRFPRANISMKTIYEYARSPYGIPEQRIPDIRDFIQSVNQDLDDYSNEISQLENRLVFLRAQHQRAQQQAAVLRSLLAPIHHLPNELLAQIFRRVCESNFHLWHFGLSKAPFRLSAVCSRWRSLCLSQSNLWIYLQLNCFGGLRTGFPVDLYLERSKQQLLTLAWFTGESEEDVIFQKLANCSPRWKEIYINSWVPSSQLRGLDFPALETLKLYADEVEEGLDLNLFERALKLQTLIVSGPRLIPNREVLGRITKLSYRTDTGNSSEILNLCPKLHTLEIKDYHPLEDAPLVSSLNVMSNLTSLHVINTDGFWRALHSLTTPALTMLSLEHFTDEDLSGHETRLYIERFLERSNCSLAKLEIKLSWMDEDVVALLRRLPTLQELTVRDLQRGECPRPITKAFLESLHSYQQSPLRQSPLPIVPKLHSLSLEVAAAGFDHKSFVKTILSRWIPDKDYAEMNGVSCLRVVELCLPDSVDEAEYLPLVRLRKLGLCFDMWR
ncbi:hypothetical protein GYMLUDRAFT_646572 [Collybiopsis luxurians FD-317 M1]|nr:hypothetical protein GYMLUDRAFT_646572 [Collybiopsis luxurians FD-317 M1]